MQLLPLFFVLLIINNIIPINSENQCPEATSFYEVLECKAIYENEGSLCPKCYNCDHLKAAGKNTTNQCYFRGNSYPSQGIIPKEETEFSCRAGCFCNDDSSFICAMYDCAAPQLDEGCYYTQSLTRCCPGPQLCPTNTTTRCQSNGREYLEGTLYPHPQKKCTICECGPEVTAKDNVPVCKRTLCEVEFSMGKNILAFCAPVYNNKSDCCPLEYICPNENDLFVNSVSPAECLQSTSCNQCRYGEQCFDIGTEFRRTTENYFNQNVTTECKCIIPPYFTCIQNSH